jgi:nitrous oxidase accessory protein
MNRAGLVALGLLGTLAVGPSRDSSAAPQAPVERREGERRLAPSGATIAETFEQLAQIVAAAEGPREVWLRGRTYHGDLAVKRPVAIRGEAGATLEGTGSGTVLSIGSSDVTVEGITVRHSGRRNTTEDAGIKATGDRIAIKDARVEETLFGVSLEGCHGCTLERVRVVGTTDPSALKGDAIKLWEAHESVVRSCLVEDSRDVVVWYTRHALVEDNIVRRSRYGTHFMYAHDSTARRNHLDGNVVGIFVMYSMRVDIEDNVLAGARGAAGMGIGFKESDDVRVRGNWLVANTTGAYLDFTPRTPDKPALFERNVFALNEVALRLHSVEKGAAFHGNDFRSGETLSVDGGGDALGCDVRGNHFSDYEGYDLDRDGVGDVPHRVTGFSSELADEHPALKFFRGTTAMHLVDAIARAVPVLSSRTLLVDTAPLVEAPEVHQP